MLDADLSALLWPDTVNNRWPAGAAAVVTTGPLADGLIYAGVFAGTPRNVMTGAAHNVVGSHLVGVGGFSNNQDSYIEVDGLGDLSVLSSYTFLVFGNFGARDGYASIFAKQSTVGQNQIQLQAVAGDTFAIEHTAGSFKYFTTGGAFAPSKITGRDTTVGLVWDGVSAHGYIDGELKESMSYNGGKAAGTAPLKIGAARDASTLAWSGTYYAAFIWRRALSTLEMAVAASGAAALLEPAALPLSAGVTPGDAGGAITLNSLTMSNITQTTARATLSLAR